MSFLAVMLESFLKIHRVIRIVFAMCSLSDVDRIDLRSRFINGAGVNHSTCAV